MQQHEWIVETLNENIKPIKTRTVGYYFYGFTNKQNEHYIAEGYVNIGYTF
jgi:hypothetical protein